MEGQSLLGQGWFVVAAPHGGSQGAAPCSFLSLIVYSSAGIFETQVYVKLWAGSLILDKPES